MAVVRRVMGKGYETKSENLNPDPDSNRLLQRGRVCGRGPSARAARRGGGVGASGSLTYAVCENRLASDLVRAGPHGGRPRRMWEGD